MYMGAHTDWAEGGRAVHKYMHDVIVTLGPAPHSYCQHLSVVDILYSHCVDVLHKEGFFKHHTNDSSVCDYQILLM